MENPQEADSEVESSLSVLALECCAHYLNFWDSVSLVKKNFVDSILWGSQGYWMSHKAYEVPGMW